MESKNIYLSGTLWAYRSRSGLDLYNPNQPYANAILRIKDGIPHLSVNDGAPRDFRIEVQDNLDKLKTLLILGG
jgi:hypothetical protein